MNGRQQPPALTKVSQRKGQRRYGNVSFARPASWQPSYSASLHPDKFATCAKRWTNTRDVRRIRSEWQYYYTLAIDRKKYVCRAYIYPYQLDLVYNSSRVVALNTPFYISRVLLHGVDTKSHARPIVCLLLLVV